LRLPRQTDGAKRGQHEGEENGAIQEVWGTLEPTESSHEHRVEVRGHGGSGGPDENIRHLEKGHKTMCVKKASAKEIYNTRKARRKEYRRRERPADERRQK
jgi:hypothetical protein